MHQPVITAELKPMLDYNEEFDQTEYYTYGGKAGHEILNVPVQMSHTIPNHGTQCGVLLVIVTAHHEIPSIGTI